MIRAANGLVLVVFTKSWGSYQTGATAGFVDKEAQRLVGIGVATYKGTPGPGAPAPARVEPVRTPRKKAAKASSSAPADEGDPLDSLPDDWRDLQWMKLKAIAKHVTDAPIENKADAIAAIELALEERSSEEGDEVDTAEGTPPAGGDENGQ